MSRSIRKALPTDMASIMQVMEAAMMFTVYSAASLISVSQKMQTFALTPIGTTVSCSMSSRNMDSLIVASFIWPLVMND